MKSFIAFFVGVFLCQISYAQLTVNGSQTNAQLAQLISGQGVSISNISVDCQTTNSGKGYGRYNALNTNLNITEGMLLTTGNINSAIGPNSSSNTSSWYGNDAYAANNSSNPIRTLIESTSGKTINEFCEFSFDIVPLGDTLKFDYVFASEEYNEYVNSNYNDVFGFYITGPNPAGGNFNNKNIAIVPNTTQAVSINTVNNGVANSNANPSGPCKNCQYFQNNNNGATVEYDAFTKNLRAVSRVTPCQTYRLKLVVADATDRKYDSAVFIEKISSPSTLSITSSTLGGTPFMIEGCNPGTVTFTRPSASLLPLTVTYFISGTATNGTDYPAIGSTNPASPKYITIGALQQSASFNITPTLDGLAEDEETIILSLDNPGCPAGYGVSHTMYIRDSIFPSLTPINPAICTGQSVTLTGSAPAGSSFTWSPNTALSTVTGSSTAASPTANTTYTMSVKLANCVETRKTRVQVNPLPGGKSLTGPALLCLGSAGDITMPLSDNGISYQLTQMPGATPVGSAQNGNGGTLTFNTGSLSATTSFGVLAVNTATTCSAQVSAPVSVPVAATPTVVSQNMDQKTCPASGTNWVTFASPSGNRAIVSVNPNGNNLGNVTATSYVNGTPIDINSCGSPQSIFATTVMNRRWTITPTTQPSSPVDVRLYFTQAEFNALMNKANINQNMNDDVYSIPQLKLTKYSGLNENGSFTDNCGNGVVGLFNPTANGNGASMFTGFDSNGRYIQFSIPSFSEFWLHGSSNGVTPLPIVLTDFKATCDGGGVKVDWSTASEINNAFFTISRSADAITWEPLTVVAGAGSSNQALSYTYTDTRPLEGTAYYRIHQTDYDGTTEYFDPVSISCDAEAQNGHVTVYPNPVEEQFTVSITTGTGDQNAVVELYDITGKKVASRQIQTTAGQNMVAMERSGLAAGTYFIRVHAAGVEAATLKVIFR